MDNKPGEKINLRDLCLEDIEAFIAGLGKERYRGRQVMKWIYQHGAEKFDDMTTLSKEFRAALSERATLDAPRIETILTSADTTRKVLFRLADGLTVESVLIPGASHWTACISSQVGCRMGCRFCFTGSLGYKRNLTPAEITGQMTGLVFGTLLGPRIKNIVFMGMGEPLDNYENVLTAIRNLTSDYGMGFSNRKITVSTCGLAPEIIRLGQDVCINLAISLNASDNAMRDTVMPVNRRYPLDELLSACRVYPMPGRRMLTFEYILMAGVNDSVRDAEKVARLLKSVRCKLNLISYNEHPGSPFKTPSPDAMAAFQKVLTDHHYTAVIRASKGRDILAACGQLSGAAQDGRG